MFRFDKDQKVMILSAIFVAALVAANLLGNKMTELFGIVTSVGIFAYPITFLMTDSIEEVYGKQKVNQLVNAAFLSLLVVVALLFISITIWPASWWTNQAEYELIHGQTLRVTVASLIAFFISQKHDVWAFDILKKKTHGKALWIRNNASTIVSQLIDTTLFMFLAFYLMTPEFHLTRIIGMIIPYWGLKIAFAIGDTPFLYAIVNWLKKE
jgi:queuosine precursor transporter